MTKNTESAYAKAGVDLKEGDSFSAFAGKICEATFKNSPYVEVDRPAGGNFRGHRKFRFVGLPDGWWMDMPTDGIGTKTITITAAGMHYSASCNLLAMTGGDATRNGDLPLVFVNDLSVSTLGKTSTKTNNMFRDMIDGLGRFAREQGYVCFRGETAELGVCVGSEDENAVTKFNWSGTMLSVSHKDRAITGDALKDGQVVVAFQDCWRSNGHSLGRRGLRTRFGENWMHHPDAMPFICEIAEPAVLYDRFFATMNGWYANHYGGDVKKIHLIAHISGGGIVDKFARDLLFPRGFSARLNDLFTPPPSMERVVEWAEVPERERYQSLGGGNGALVVVDRGDAERLVACARKARLNAKVCGTIMRDNDPTLVITSRFNGEELEYKPGE